MVRTSPLAKSLMNSEGAPPSRWRLVGTRGSEQHKQLRLERASHTATAVNGHVYVIAGRKGSTFYGDVLRFDTINHTWSFLFPAIPNGFRPRANHTATLVGGRHIWVIAGSDNEQVIGDVHVFDVQTHTWTKPQIRGETSLLSRTAHSAELHPCDPRAIVVFGGYDGANFHNDLYVIRTDAMLVERLTPTSGVPPPVPRGYHSCTALGSRCYVYGGRTEDGVVAASEMLAVYDAALNRWVAPQVSGAWPHARSSHRAVALGNRLLIHGGAAAGEQDDRLADLHTLAVCPHTGRLSWSHMDEPPPPPAPGSAAAAHNRPQGRSAHTVSLVGSDSLYVVCGYVGAKLGPHRYSADVYQLLLGTPVGEPPPPQPLLSPPQQQQQHQHQPSPRRSPPRQPQLQAHLQDPAAPQHSPRPARPSPRPGEAPTGGSSVGQGSSNSAHPASTLRHDPPVPAPPEADAPQRPGKRRLGGPPQAAPAPAGRSGGGEGGSGAGAEDDPIDLTAEQPQAATPPMAAAAAAAASRRLPAAQRSRAGGEPDTAAPAEGAWLGGARRGRGGGVMQQKVPEMGGAAAAAAGERAASAAGGPATGMHGHPLAAKAPAGDAADGRAAKRQASDAAVAAATVAAPPARGRLPVQTQPLAGVVTASAPSAATAAVAAAQPVSNSAPPLQQLQQHPSMAASGLTHAAMGWQAQAEMYGLQPGTIAAAATAAATAAVAATTAAGNGTAHGAYNRPPSPPHAGLASISQETLLTQLLEDNKSLRRQLQEVQERERLTNQQLAALHEQQRRTADELTTQRRGCEMTQAALRTANDELGDARSQLEQLQHELAAVRQQANVLQQDLGGARQQAAAAQLAAGQQQHQAAERERALLAERAALLAAQAEEARKGQEQIKSLESLCGRHQAEAERVVREQRAEAERAAEAAAALNERLGKREQDVAELTTQLREAAAQNQKLQQEAARLADVKQRLERDLSEAREGHGRLQRQMDEQLGELTRQRDTAQMQLSHANTRLSALESELRRTKDDLAHRDAQHAALLAAAADKEAALAAAREQLRASQQRHEVLRQQAGLLASQMQSLQATAQAMAAGT